MECSMPGCTNLAAFTTAVDGAYVCGTHNGHHPILERITKESMSSKYPKYYKAIPAGTKELDVYGVCALFPVKDDTGCINHARKKLLVPGTRTGGKSFRDDIKEARDTLTRWLELNPEETK